MVEAGEVVVVTKPVKEIRELKAEVKRLKQTVEAAKGPNKNAGNYSKDPEKRAAELMTRNAVLETSWKIIRSI